MKVALVSTSDIGHGAGIAAYRLHRGLIQAGVKSRLLVTEKLSHDDTVIQLPHHPTSRSVAAVQHLFRMTEHLLNVVGLQNIVSLSSPYLIRNMWLKNADLIHLHNIHSHSRYFSLLQLPYLSRTPLLWTLHDMWPMTGHCYYPSDCTRWMNCCGNCPDLGIYPRMLFDATAPMFFVKRRLLKSTDITLAAPSEWMKNQTERSPIFAGKQVCQIPNGIDMKVYYPRNRLAIRAELGIKEVDRVLLFVSSQLDDPRKGLSQLIHALNRLLIPRERLLIMTMGGGNCEQFSDFRTISLGYQANEEYMSRIYSAADLQVVPSLQDNLPNVVLESLACGTPVVCFDCGGLRDIINHFDNGYLARFKDVTDLATGIEWVLNRPINDVVLREKAVASIRRRFDLTITTAAHVELYKELINSRGGVR